MRGGSDGMMSRAWMWRKDPAPEAPAASGSGPPTVSGLPERVDGSQLLVQPAMFVVAGQAQREEHRHRSAQDYGR